jgi:hypothetical protein
MELKCLICGAPMSFFFAGQFPALGLDRVEYWRCDNCGFVISKTHVEMDPATWERVNYAWHASYQGKKEDDRDPNWINRINNQALVLHDLWQMQLLNDKGRWLDYACGDAKLSRTLGTRYHLPLLNYERYMPHREDFLDVRDLVPGGFDLVITTGVFEHLTRREQFDGVEALVSKAGVLGTHTLVCENVPADPTWFYLNPVHCAFHTNKSMEILFRQWGYTCSIYNVEAQLWLWFQTDPHEVDAAIRRANDRAQGPFYVYKEGFVDYWKGSPLCRRGTSPALAAAGSGDGVGANLDSPRGRTLP